MAGTVVPIVSDITDAEFHALMVLGLNRAEQHLGTRRALAMVLDLSTKQTGNLFKGASTDPKRLFDVLLACPTALDDIADRYGFRIVPKDAVCSTDARPSSALVDLLAKVIAADGTPRDHRALLGMEPEIRAVSTILTGWLDDIAQLRRPTAVAA